MSLTWRGESDLPVGRPDTRGHARAVLRGLPILLLLLVSLAATGLLRLVERPLCHPRRPVTPWVAVFVCRGTLRLLGLRVRRVGVALATERGAIVANHSSWLDILVLNAAGPMTFVAKSEVAGWAGIGHLARATGTLHVRREARAASGVQVEMIAERLAAGSRLALFPEGTSTDGRRVLPFRTTLFEGLLGPGLVVQPVTLDWRAPEGEDPRFYAWFGGTDFGPHCLAVLAARRQGAVTVTTHPPISAMGRDRKSLAREAEAAVRSAL